MQPAESLAEQPKLAGVGPQRCPGYVGGRQGRPYSSQADGVTFTDGTSSLTVGGDFMMVAPTAGATRTTALGRPRSWGPRHTNAS